MNGVVVFPGQGAQKLGMGLDLVEASPAARAVFERAASVLGFDLRDVIGGDDAEALDRTDVCQPAILVTSLAAMAALDERDAIDEVRVAGVAGLSLGEYSALAWAGALELDDAIRLVRLRGEAMQRASDERPSGMLSLIGADAQSAAALCDAARGDGVLVVANLLAPGQVAISGTSDAIERAQGLAREHGVRKAVPLPVAGAFHSACMASAADALADALASVEIHAPRVPVVMNVSATPATDAETIADSLRRQLTAPVLWHDSMRALFAMAGDPASPTVLEPAPGKQLTNMLKRDKTLDACVATCADADELGALDRWPPADDSAGES